MENVTVYTTEPCRHCQAAKELLQRREVAFEEVSLAKDPSGRAELAERTGMMSFPQITIGEAVIGGFDDLIRADEAGVLNDLAVVQRAGSAGTDTSPVPPLES